MKISGSVTPDFRNSRATSIAVSEATPCSRARWLDFWMVGPSASGSLNGTPSSTTSAPAASSSGTIWSVAFTEG